jgi:hypothetical protein
MRKRPLNRNRKSSTLAEGIPQSQCFLTQWCAKLLNLPSRARSIWVKLTPYHISRPQPNLVTKFRSFLKPQEAKPYPLAPPWAKHKLPRALTIYVFNLFKFRRKEILRYGPERGSKSTLSALASFLNSSKGYRRSDYISEKGLAVREERVKENELMITGGCSMVLTLILNICLNLNLYHKP